MEAIWTDMVVKVVSAWIRTSASDYFLLDELRGCMPKRNNYVVSNLKNWHEDNVCPNKNMKELNAGWNGIG